MHTLEPAKMDFNPVIHDQGSLSFEASKALANMIAFIKGQLLSIMASLWFVFLLESINVFNVCGKTINLVYILAQLILIAAAIFVTYTLINRVKPVVEMTGRVVSITNQTVSVTPFTFNLRFWRKQQPQKLAFEISELKIRKTDNPLRFVKVSDSFKNRVFELRDKNQKAYIVFDYYDAMLKEKLTDILVEVTPPELLIPGRLRHR